MCTVDGPVTMSPAQYEEKLAMQARTRETSKGYEVSGGAARDAMVLPNGQTVLQASDDAGRAAVQKAWDARQPAKAPGLQDEKRAQWNGRRSLLTGGGGSGAMASGGTNTGGGSLLGG